MFISTVVCLVPVVDCSEAVGVVEMTEVMNFHLTVLLKGHFDISYFYSDLGKELYVKQNNV